MKAILIILIAIHGLIHLMGFHKKEWNLAPVSQLSGVTLFTMTKNVAQLVGTFWLLSTIALLFAATVLLFNKEWWWIPAIAGVFVSQLLIIIYWKDAKWGTLINIIILLVSIISFCEWNFNKKEYRRK